MKRIKYSIVTAVVSVLLLSSCSDSFFDINKDPNNSDHSTPALSFTSAVAGSAYVMGGYYQALGGFWTQQYAQSPGASQWADWESYNLTEDDFNRQFRVLYASALEDYEYIRNATAKTGDWSYYSMATLMQAYTFQVLADLYDQVPFTEALKGDGNLQPHYDAGSVVYDSLLVRIDDAMSKDFSAATSEDPGKYDVIFGDKGKESMSYWKKFANTLKLKIYMRYVNVDANKYKAKIIALLNENDFLDSDAMFAAFKAEETGYNPFYNTFIDRLAGNVIANTTLTDSVFSKTNDPRLGYFFNASVTGNNYNGVPTGAYKTLSGTTSSNYATPAISAVYPVYFFTVEEVNFLKAEAQLRYGTQADAKAEYKAGIIASFERCEKSAKADNNTKLDSLLQVYSSYVEKDSLYAFDGLKSIMVQKWVASTNMRSIEAFFDYNRTGYPDFFTISKTSVLNGKDRPQRLFFPENERSTNKNTPAKVALNVPVWWGKK